MLLFDTGKKLEKAFTSEQFDALVGVLEKRDDQLASSTDIVSLKADVREGELRLQSEILLIRKEIKEVELRLETKVEASKHEVLKWVMGMFIAQTGVLAALYAIMR